MRPSFLIVLIATALAASGLKCTAQNATAAQQKIEPIEGMVPDYPETELLEDYDMRIRDQKEAMDNQGSKHHPAGTCYRPHVIPGVAYKCIKGDDMEVLEPPFPLAIPQNFQWEDIAVRDLGFVPVTDAVDGAKTVDEWFEKAKTSPRLRCNQLRCLELVAYTAATEKPGQPGRWLSVCSRYKIGTDESLPLDCMYLVLEFKDKTWVLVPGQCNACGGPMEVEDFITCMAPGADFLREMQIELQSDPWRLQTRLLNTGIVASTPASKARFVAGWEKMSIRLDVVEESSIVRQMFLMFDRYNTTKFAENPQYSEIYESRLRETAINACQKACANTGGIPVLEDSWRVGCNAKAGKNGKSHVGPNILSPQVPPRVSGSPTDLPLGATKPAEKHVPAPAPSKKDEENLVLPTVPPDLEQKAPKEDR